MPDQINQTNEQSAGVGIRERLKAQYSREHIERNRQKNLRIAQNQALLTSQRVATPTVEPQNVQNDWGDEPAIDTTATTPETTVETKPTVKDKIINRGKHYIIGTILGLISFGLLTIPYAIYRLVWGKKK